jgi:hypothetical protein
VHSLGQMRVAGMLLLLAGLTACSPPGISAGGFRRPYHLIKTVAIVGSGTLYEGVAVGIDSGRFVVLGPSATDALFDELDIKTWAWPPYPGACRLLAAAGVDVVVSGGTAAPEHECAWEFLMLAYSVRTRDPVTEVSWCPEKGAGRPDSLALAAVGREMGRELGRRLRQASAPG